MIPYRDNMPTRTFPVVTILVLILNVAAFFYQLTLGPYQMAGFLTEYAVIPVKLQLAVQGQADLAAFGMSLFTSMFLHGGIMHLGGNMLYLWVFADNVEERMGAVRFVAFYLICGLAAGLTHIAFNPASNVPTIGASGAVSGVLGAYLLSFPFARIRVIVPLLVVWPVIELPAIFMLGVWFLMQLFSGTQALGASAAEGVAWWAHIGGFLAGMALINLFALRPVRRYYWAEEKGRRDGF